MRAILGLVGLSGPGEGRVFGFLGAFGVAIAAIYWFLSYEVAGTVLLGSFGLATALIGFAAARAVARPPHDGRLPDGAGAGGPGPDPDRPLHDESGRIPSPTLAPLAVGAGLSIAATAIVFGPAALLVGAPPALWGMVTWLHRAIAELRAVDRDAAIEPPEQAGPVQRSRARTGDETAR